MRFHDAIQPCQKQIREPKVLVIDFGDSGEENEVES